jgi:hypothetical protein
MAEVSQTNKYRRGPNTVDVYREYMKKQNAEPEIVSLEQGAFGGWIGSSRAKNVLLYFHGISYSCS